ncbi:MAG: T9SS type A sorting domain-containing protein [Candidatus Delongbacteria bacterium]|nr:T9SS type A sorting domain-containing protein [Candidatus Delongbacteria bacterium]
MLKKVLAFALFVIIAMPLLAVENGLVKNSCMKLKTCKTIADTKLNSASKMPYIGEISPSFDKAGNGYGWVYAYNRKVQWNLDPVTGPMVASIYRQLDVVAGAGTIGGMTGVWDTAFSSYKETLYDYSPYWDQKPGGRYPCADEFINGYFFCQFNDFDSYGSGSSTDSWGMYTVADVTWGYDWVTWPAPRRLEATEGGATIPGAWTGTGDVVYDPVTGYYYWTQSWGENGLDGGIDQGITSVCVGRSMTPADLDSWVWSDYHDLRFDGLDDTVGITSLTDFQVAYCKDIYGNGTGYGIAVNIVNDVDDVIDYNGSPYTQNPKISWMYTTNWGGDDSSGDWSPNWIHPSEDKLYRLEMKDIFDWYGESLTSRDSIGVDGDGNIVWDTTEVLLMNDPFITWNISDIATEDNNVHVLFKAFPGSMDSPEGIYSATDAGFRSGYYHLKGTITPTGVTWKKARYIGSIVDMDKGWDFVEWTYSNRNFMSIGYAGKFEGREVIFADWLDKPTSRAVLNTFPNPEMTYYTDAYFTTSTDGGMNWDVKPAIEFETGDENYPIWTQTYVENVTKTSTLHEQGFAVANHGTVDATGFITTYAASQYYDPNNPIPPPNDDVADYQQFLHVWKISGKTNGIEAEEVSLNKDFVLYQNYPNPFNPITSINFILQSNSEVKLSVFNTKGEVVANLCNGKMGKGMHKVDFDADSFNSGVYFYRLTVNGMNETKKMMLIK